MGKTLNNILNFATMPLLILFYNSAILLYALKPGELPYSIYFSNNPNLYFNVIKFGAITLFLVPILIYYATKTVQSHTSTTDSPMGILAIFGGFFVALCFVGRTPFNPINMAMQLPLAVIAMAIVLRIFSRLELRTLCLSAFVTALILISILFKVNTLSLLIISILVFGGVLYFVIENDEVKTSTLTLNILAGILGTISYYFIATKLWL